jgi:hypothetical protein
MAIIATAAIYWPGLTGGWVFDDYPNIVDNPDIHIAPGHSTLGAWVNSLLSSPSSFLHRPLASLTFSLNWYLGGSAPWSFKLTNIIIHLLNGALLFGMLRALLRLLALHTPKNIDPAAASRLALFVTASWMLLPINLMAVLYVVQRMESLCQVFMLAGLWAYLHGRWMMLTAQVSRRDRQGFALAVSGMVLGTVLGLTAKESAVLLPVFAFLTEWILLRFARVPSAQQPGKVQDPRLWWSFVVTLFVPAILGFAWLLRAALRPGTWVGRDFNLAQRLLTEPRVLVDYLHWTLLPNPMVLSLYHDDVVVSTGLLTPWTTLAAIAFLVALIVLAVWLRHRQPLVTLGIGWFFAAQLLTATIIPLELVYEQRMYFGSIGVLLAVGTWLLGLRWKIALPILRGFLVTIFLLWLALVTHLRAMDWSHPLRLAVTEAKNHPTSGRAVYEAGRLLLIASNYEPGKMRTESLNYLQQAAAIPGSSVLPDQALIMLVDHDQQGDDNAYWESLVRKLRDQPTGQENISALMTLTQCHSKGGCKFDSAQLQRAYQAVLSRPHPIARLNAAYAVFQRDVMHDDLLAEKYLILATTSEPNEPAYRIDLAVLYTRHGQPDKAQVQIDALRRLNYAGRLDKQLAALDGLTKQSKSSADQRDSYKSQ